MPSLRVGKILWSKSEKKTIFSSASLPLLVNSVNVTALGTKEIRGTTVLKGTKLVCTFPDSKIREFDSWTYIRRSQRPRSEYYSINQSRIKLTAVSP